jgi:fructokinase
VIVVAGEALIDLVTNGGDGYRAVVGGSPANVAVGLARLDQHVRLLARISADPFGQRIRAYLVANDVDLAWAVDAAEPTSLAIASLDAHGHAEYAFYLNGTADWQWSPDQLPPSLNGVTAVHSGSLALSMSPGADVLEAMLAAAPVTVSIDINLRPSICPDRDAERSRVERQIRHAQLVKASQEDVAWLYPDRTVEQTATAWQASGATCIIVTLGGDGVYLLRPDGVAVSTPALPVDVVDTVGAGDSFTGGLLSALAAIDALGADPAARLTAVTADQWRAAVDYANTVAALTCGRFGADPPTAAEVASAVNGD